MAETEKSQAVKQTPLSDGEKAAMLLMRGKGMDSREIARALGRADSSVRRFLIRIRKLAEGAGVNYDFKDDLKIRSIDAIKSGLDCDEDPYKRGNLGVNVLKGIGVFAQDGAQVHVNQMFAAVPPDWAGRYVTLENGGPDGAIRQNEVQEGDAPGADVLVGGPAIES